MATRRTVLLALLLAAGGSAFSPPPGQGALQDSRQGPTGSLALGAAGDRLGSVAAVRPLPFLYDLYTFRGDEGTTVVAAFAVEAGELEREHVEDGVRYRFDVSLFLADTVLRTVTSSHDSVYVELGRPLPSDHLLYTAVEVHAPPSGNTLQRVVMFNATTPGIGQLYTGGFPIPDYSGGHLMLSDIALGQPDAVNGWKRGGVTIALLPAGRFPASAFDVYYEIYNLPTGNPYVTTISVDRVDEEGIATARVVDIRFAGESSAGRDAVQAERRRVESSLERGRYRITVTITDMITGQSATNSRTLEVHSNARGATMVPALPVAGASGRLSAR
jgi:hypothetical protein